MRRARQNDEAREMFQRAIDLDPNYAAAYAALGGTHFDAVVSGWTEFRDEEVEHAETLAQKALALDPATTSAYRLLAIINMYRRRYDLALGQIDRALEINPSDADSYRIAGKYFGVGRQSRRGRARGSKARSASTAPHRGQLMTPVHGVLFSRPLRRSDRGR